MRLTRNLLLVPFVLLFMNDGAKAEKPAGGPIVVFTKKAALSDLFDTLTYPARVESKVNAQIQAEGDGVISKIFANLGGRVKRSAKLLVIRHTDPVYQYAPMAVFSPVEGSVSQILVTEGSRVAKGQPLMNITDPKNLRFVIEVAAQDVPVFHPKLAGEFGAAGARNVPVLVKGISLFVDPGTGTATCELEAKQTDPKNPLLPGLVGQVTFQVNHRRGFVLPDHAIVYKDAGTFVRIVQNGKAKKVAIKLGRRERGNVEVLEGLHDNDQVIERASGFVPDGEAVQVMADANDKKQTAPAAPEAGK